MRIWWAFCLSLSVLLLAATAFHSRATRAQLGKALVAEQLLSIKATRSYLVGITDKKELVAWPLTAISTQPEPARMFVGSFPDSERSIHASTLHNTITFGTVTSTFRVNLENQTIESIAYEHAQTLLNPVVSSTLAVVTQTDPSTDPAYLTIVQHNMQPKTILLEKPFGSFRSPIVHWRGDGKSLYASSEEMLDFSSQDPLTTGDAIRENHIFAELEINGKKRGETKEKAYRIFDAPGDPAHALFLHAATKEDDSVEYAYILQMADGSRMPLLTAEANRNADAAWCEWSSPSLATCIQQKKRTQGVELLVTTMNTKSKDGPTIALHKMLASDEIITHMIVNHQTDELLFIHPTTRLLYSLPL